MKFGKLYSDATKLNSTYASDTQAEQTLAGQQEDAARAQARFQWKSSTITQEVSADIHREINDLITKAIGLAVSYPTHTNHQQIIQNLIRVDTLSKLLEKHIK